MHQLDGVYSSVIGGYDNQATGYFSLALGRSASALYDGSFVFAGSDVASGASFPAVDTRFETEQNRQFLIGTLDPESPTVDSNEWGQYKFGFFNIRCCCAPFNYTLLSDISGVDSDSGDDVTIYKDLIDQGIINDDGEFLILTSNILMILSLDQVLVTINSDELFELLL